MNTHDDNTKDTKSQRLAKEGAQKHTGNEHAFRVTDNRTETVAHDTYQKMADNSLQVAQTARLQSLVNAHPVSQMQDRGIKVDGKPQKLGPVKTAAQMKFTYKKTVYDKTSAKLPKIHGISSKDIENLAQSDEDFGELRDKSDFTESIEKMSAVIKKTAKVPLADKFAGHHTVGSFTRAWVFRDKDSVDITCQLDWGQGKHDSKYSGKDGRTKSGGEQVPEGFDYEGSAETTVLPLLQSKLDQLATKGEQEPLNFAVQMKQQSDGLHYEISAAWEVLDDSIHILVYYHCYPPRK
jgi:hypothetical protein